MSIRDRIKDFRRVPASELRQNPHNWRQHPQEQREALRGVLAEIGCHCIDLALYLGGPVRTSTGLADLLAHEKVDIYDCTNGNRLATYVIEGERGSGVIGINGAAAHLVKPGDHVIIASYVQMETDAARAYEPRICFVDAQNVLR